MSLREGTRAPPRRLSFAAKDWRIPLNDISSYPHL